MLKEEVVQNKKRKVGNKDRHNKKEVR